MQLSDEQQETVRGWAAEGATLSEIQKRLKDELGVAVTYLEVRMLAADLELSLRDPKKEEQDKAKAKEAEQAAAGGGDGGDGGDGGGDEESLDELLGDDGEGAGGGGVSVTVDSIAVPGTVVSGGVTFSDGKAAKWYLDQMGRLGLDPDEPGHRPSESDVAAFQRELQEVLRKQGF